MAVGARPGCGGRVFGFMRVMGELWARLGALVIMF